MEEIEMRKYKNLKERVNSSFNNMSKNIKDTKHILEELKESNKEYSQKINALKRGW